MRELIAFLTARLDDDERIAMAATGQKWGQPAEHPEYWRWECTEDDVPIDVDLAIASGQEVLEHGEHWGAGLRSAEKYPSAVGDYGHLIIGNEEVRPQDARHIARHDPARALREVAAKRAIVNAFEHNYDPDEVVENALANVVRQLATVYSNHPDYNPDWQLG